MRFTVMLLCICVAVDHAGHSLAQPEAPTPVEAIMKVIKAYAAYQSRTSTTVVDVEGTTDWYRQWLREYAPLKVSYDLSPPELTKDTRDAKGVRLSTFMCPSMNFTYSCQLDAAVIRGSASATTHTSQWTVGATTKHTWLYGVSFLGTGGKVGPVVQFGFSWAGNSGTADATTEQSTNTGTQLLSVDAASASCYEVVNYMARATQQGRSKLRAVFSEYVGFANDPPVAFEDDQHWCGLRTRCLFKYRVRSIWDIVRTAQAAGLVEASPFDPFNANDTWAVALDNTFDTSFFLGSEGRGIIKNYSVSSDNCAKMLPDGWDEWLPPLSAPTSAMAAGSGRRLAGQLSMRLLPSTLEVAQGLGAGMSTRVLLGATGSALTGGTPARAWGCPHRGHVGRQGSGITRIKNPTCSGEGFQTHQAELAAQRRAAAGRRRQCALAVIHGSGNASHSIHVKARNARCAVVPTPKALLDAHDANAGKRPPAAGQPMDFNSKLSTLVKAVCYYESHADCQVDMEGQTWWYERYFKAYPPIRGFVGADEIKMDPTAFSASGSSWFCAYNPAVAFTCQAAAADMTSKATTKSSTTTWNFSFKLGFKLKAQASFIGIGPTAEYETENSIDWGYSYSDGSSTTETDGASTTATVRVPVTPAMNKCVTISVVTRKAAAKGFTRAWGCASGWLGTSQDTDKHWPDVDTNPSESHMQRAFNVTYIVALAKDKKLNYAGAQDWFIDAQGRACLYNTIEMDLQQGVMSFAQPQLHDSNSSQCNPAALGLGPLPLQQTPVLGDDGVVTVAASPIPGYMDRPCADLAGKDCIM